MSLQPYNQSIEFWLLLTRFVTLVFIIFLLFESLQQFCKFWCSFGNDKFNIKGFSQTWINQLETNWQVLHHLLFYPPPRKETLNKRVVVYKPTVPCNNTTPLKSVLLKKIKTIPNTSWEPNPNQTRQVPTYHPKWHIKHLWYKLLIPFQ